MADAAMDWSEGLEIIEAFYASPTREHLPIDATTMTATAAAAAATTAVSDSIALRDGNSANRATSATTVATGSPVWDSEFNEFSDLLQWPDTFDGDGSEEIPPPTATSAVHTKPAAFPGISFPSTAAGDHATSPQLPNPPYETSRQDSPPSSPHSSSSWPDQATGQAELPLQREPGVMADFMSRLRREEAEQEALGLPPYPQVSGNASTLQHFPRWKPWQQGAVDLTPLQPLQTVHAQQTSRPRYVAIQPKPFRSFQSSGVGEPMAARREGTSPTQQFDQLETDQMYLPNGVKRIPILSISVARRQEPESSSGDVQEGQSGPQPVQRSRRDLVSGLPPAQVSAGQRDVVPKVHKHIVRSASHVANKSNDESGRRSSKLRPLRMKAREDFDKQ